MKSKDCVVVTYGLVADGAHVLGSAEKMYFRTSSIKSAIRKFEKAVDKLSVPDYADAFGILRFEVIKNYYAEL